MKSTFASLAQGLGTVSCHCCFTACFDNASEAGNAVFSCHSALSRAVPSRWIYQLLSDQLCSDFQGSSGPSGCSRKRLNLRIKHWQGQEDLSDNSVLSLHSLGCACRDVPDGKGTWWICTTASPPPSPDTLFRQKQQLSQMSWGDFMVWCLLFSPNLYPPKFVSNQDTQKSIQPSSLSTNMVNSRCAGESRKVKLSSFFRMFPTLHWAVFHPEGNLLCLVARGGFYSMNILHHFVKLCNQSHCAMVRRCRTGPSWSCSGCQELIHSLLTGFLHQFGKCLSCSRRFCCRYIETWICMDIDTSICNYGLHLCACCHRFMAFGTWADWMDVFSLWHGFTDPQTTSAFAFHKQCKIWVHPDEKPT